MNDSKNSSNGLLVLKLSTSASDKTIADLTEVIRPTADALGVEPMVLPFGVDVELQMGTSALLERVCAALEEIAVQGRMPEVNAAEIAPHALNARQHVDTVNVADGPSRVLNPTGLNTRG